MIIPERAIKLIKEFEGCNLKTYDDGTGTLTIGYGITNADKSITGKTIKKGMSITRETADEWLRVALEKKYKPLVMKYDSAYHFNQNEFSALLSFCFNIGSIDQLTAKGTRSKAVISDKMLEYNKMNGKPAAGLIRRREAERKMFLEKYTGQLPSFSKDRAYYKYNDGILTLVTRREDIKKIQRFLQWKGLYDGAIDGKYGRQTDSAVEVFQKSEGVKVINGCWGKYCQEKAKKYC